LGNKKRLETSVPNPFYIVFCGRFLVERFKRAIDVSYK